MTLFNYVLDRSLSCIRVIQYQNKHLLFTTDDEYYREDENH